MNRRDALKSLLALPIAVKAVPNVPAFTDGQFGKFGPFYGGPLHGTEAVLPASVARQMMSNWVEFPPTLTERMLTWPEPKE